MKRSLILFTFLLSGLIANAQWKPFRFAFLSDTHIGSPNGSAEEDLRRSVADINHMTDIAFVVITGDITELGTDTEIKLAKEILSELKVKYYIIPGNHDSGWSESGGVTFGEIFGDDKFAFEFNGISFLGCASGPYVRMSDGHIPRDAVIWLEKELKKIGPQKPIIFLNHYPLDKDLDNWYEVIDQLKQHNTLAALCGHGHNNHALNFEGIPAVMGRSNLRAKAAFGGYNLVDIRTDSMIFSERTPGMQTKTAWTKIKLEPQTFDHNKTFPRPSYLVNDSFPNVHPLWIFASDANVISTPVVAKGLVIFGNSLGRIDALAFTTGKKQWSYQTGKAIYSSPAVSGNKLVIGSGDGNIYCLSADKGKLIWQFKTQSAVLGCPIIDNNKVYIGGSDHHFRALDLNNGKELWNFGGLDGPVVSKPVIYNGSIIFGAWDKNLYALNTSDGRLIWKWNNGSPIRNYSPAACIPVIKNDVVYIVAPDRYITAIDMITGTTLWRNNESTVRESIGISADGNFVYGKTMNDTIVAFATSREKQKAAWKMDAGFGYEHVPSMLIEKEGLVFFGTKNGKVYAVNPKTQEKRWVHKIDNSMVNTLNVISSKQIIAATMDGKVTLLEIK